MGVQYLGLPNDASTAELISADGLGKLLKAVPTIYPLTIIDVGSELNDVALKALEKLNFILFVTTPDILAMNQTKRLYGDLVSMMFPKEMLQVVLNQFVKGHPVTPDVVARTIGKPILGMIAKDEQTCIQALNAKKPAVLGSKNSTFSKGVGDLIRKILQQNILKLASVAKPDIARVEKRQ